jgi:hypothetical protein
MEKEQVPSEPVGMQSIPQRFPSENVRSTQHLYHTYHYTEEEKEKNRQKAKLHYLKTKEAIEATRGYKMRPHIHRTPEEMKEKQNAYGREYYRKNKSKILEKARRKYNKQS